MSTQPIRLYGELTKIVFHLSSSMHSSVLKSGAQVIEMPCKAYLLGWQPANQGEITKISTVTNHIINIQT